MNKKNHAERSFINKKYRSSLHPVCIACTRRIQFESPILTDYITFFPSSRSQVSSDKTKSDFNAGYILSPNKKASLALLSVKKVDCSHSPIFS